MKALILLSGGLDSAVAYELACEKYGNENVQPMFFFYKQKTAEKEFTCACELANRKGQKLIDLTLYLGFLDSSLLMDKGGTKHGNLPTTFVPGRNIIQLAYAGSYAKEHRIENVYGGWNAMDFSGYPDCTSSFLKNMEWALRRGLDFGSLRICHPLMNFRKHEIVKIGSMLKVPFELTWSCYTNIDKPCNECESCKLRNEAFTKAGVEDPLC